MKRFVKPNGPIRLTFLPIDAYNRPQHFDKSTSRLAPGAKALKTSTSNPLLVTDPRRDRKKEKMAFAFVIGRDPERVDLVRDTVIASLEAKVKDVATVFPIYSGVPKATHEGEAENLVLVILLHEELLVGKEKALVELISGFFDPFSVFVTVARAMPWGTGGKVI